MERGIMAQFLTPKAVCAKIALSRATLDRLVAAGDFPAPMRLPVLVSRATIGSTKRQPRYFWPESPKRCAIGATLTGLSLT
jgi:hypothetical protein